MKHIYWNLDANSPKSIIEMTTQYLKIIVLAQF